MSSGKSFVGKTVYTQNGHCKAFFGREFLGPIILIQQKSG